MDMMRFSIGDVDSAEYGFYISDRAVWTRPKPDVTTVHVPGRNGDLTFDSGSYQNVTVKYSLFGRDAECRLDDMLDACHSVRGYARMEDTYHPEEFRMARIKGEAVPTVNRMNGFTRIELEFDVMPQRWLKSGELPLEINSGDKLTNPTRHNAKPLIIIKNPKAGTVLFGNGKFYILSGIPTESIYIDCESMNAYYGSTNLNGYVEINEWPELIPGDTFIESDQTDMLIIPRWWKL